MDELIERVAAAMYEAPAPDEPDAPISPWPPRHPDDLAWWITRAQVAINTIKRRTVMGGAQMLFILFISRSAYEVEGEGQ